MIANVTAVSSNVIVVVHSVGPVIMPWVDNPNITAILWTGLPGQESGNSLVDVLYGSYNPGGKLPFTIGASRTDYTTGMLTFLRFIFTDVSRCDVLSQQRSIRRTAARFHRRSPNRLPRLRRQRRHSCVRVWIRSLLHVSHSFLSLSPTEYPSTFEFSSLVATPASVGPYTPTTGTTLAAPVLGNYSTNPSDYLFPSDIQRIPLYIYPYINSTNLKASADDPDYGEPASQYIPGGATDPSPQPLLPAGGAPGGNPGLYE